GAGDDHQGCARARSAGVLHGQEHTHPPGIHHWQPEGGKRPRGGNARMNARVLLLITITMIAQFACAQVTGKVRITGIPDQGLRYVLDGKYEMTEREVTLTEGDHHFTFWAPEHKVLDTTIFVMGNWTYDLKIVLQ